jgi:hypothetical protein
MKILHEPSNQFFKELYELFDEFICPMNIFNGNKIIINNIAKDDINLQSASEAGLTRYRITKREKVEFKIGIIELTSFIFKEPEFQDLSLIRYGDYLRRLKIKFNPEVICVLILLHEIGHIEYILSFNNSIDGDNISDDFSTLKSYTQSLANIFNITLKPWNGLSNLSLQVLQSKFDPEELSADLFALKYFPCFIEFLTKYGFKEEE